MRDSGAEPFHQLLRYLREVGYGEMYLKSPPESAGASRLEAAGGSEPGSEPRSAPQPPASSQHRPPAKADSGQAPSAAARGAAARGTEPPAQGPAMRPSAGSAPAEQGAPAADPAPLEPAGGRDAPSPPPDPIPGALFTLDQEPDPGAEERARDLAALAREASGCERCKLCATRNLVVFGDGNPDADLMFIGEGPGAEEDRRGLPFVGRAGELLTKMIGAMGFDRGDVYIANVVKCRPPGNRDPQPDEVAACRRYLERQIALIRPKVIVALGRVAAQTLLGLDSPLGRMRGRWHLVQGVPTRVTYHPAALLRTPAWKRPTWEDLQLVRDRVREG